MQKIYLLHFVIKLKKSHFELICGPITPKKIPKQEIYQNHFTQYSAFIILLLQAKKLEKVNALVIDQT